MGGQFCTSLSVNSASSISCRTPSSGSTGAEAVIITNNDNQTATLNSGYTYYATPTYTSLQSDVLTPKCASCHGGNGGLFVGTYSSIAARVVAGDYASSLLYQRVASDSMPSGGPALSSIEKQKIMDWISAGAPNN